MVINCPGGIYSFRLTTNEKKFEPVTKLGTSDEDRHFSLYISPPDEALRPYKRSQNSDISAFKLLLSDLNSMGEVGHEDP